MSTTRRGGVPPVRMLAALALLPAAVAAAAPGRFVVGVSTLGITKASVTTGAPRTLATVVWYPAARGTGTPGPIGRRDAAVERGRHPLIMFSHGTCGRPTEASYLATVLASAGFVVAAPSHPGNTSDDGPSCLSSQVFVDSALNRVPDVRFALDAMLAAAGDPSSRFFRRLRPDAVAMSGLSFGGFTALLAAQQEPRFAAALAMVPGGTAFLGPDDIRIPTMVIGSERDMVVGWVESEQAFQRLAGPRFLVELLGANHLSVVDSCDNPDLGVSFCVAGDIPQEAAHRLVLRYALPFFRRYLAHRHVARARLERPVAGVQLVAEP